MRWALSVIAAVGLLPASAASAAQFVEGTAGIPQPLVTFPSPAPAQAKITWGDGSPADTTTVDHAPDGTGSVSGAHAYAKHGSYTVTVEDAANAATSRTTTATVDDAPITAEGSVNATTAAAGGLTLATISDANPSGVPESLRATVDWGDGTTSTATIVSAGAPGRYLVQDSHAYPDGGSYLATITISSNDGGTAQATADARFDGVAEPVAPVTQGKILDLGVASLGGRPSITVDEAGTAYVVWTTLSHNTDAIAFCRVPRGAKGCDLRRTLNYAPFASTTTILRGPSGRLYIVAAHILTGRGGTIVLTSADNGQTWSPRRYDVNVGIFQSAVSGAALSRDESAMYITYGPFFNLSNAPLQGIARLDLGSNAVPWIGDESFQRRVVVGAGVLPDGRAVALANRHPDVTDGPPVALRVIADSSNATTDQPWTPVNAASARKVATSRSLASILDCSPVKVDPFGTRLGAVPLRGLQGGTVRAFGFLRADNSDCSDVDLTYDAAGGRHVTYVASADGCPYGDDVSPGLDNNGNKRFCIVYRAAKPNGDFRPKTILAEINPESKVGGVAIDFPQAPRVGAGRDGQGWVVWHSFGDGHIRMIATRDDTEATVTAKHTISLKPSPNGECTNTNSLKVSATAGGPASGRPKILSVAWRTTRGVLPRTQTDKSAPFSITAKTDQRVMHNIGSTGVVIFGSLLQAKIRYRVGKGAAKVTRLQLPLTYFCSIKWDKVEQLYEKG